MNLLWSRRAVNWRGTSPSSRIWFLQADEDEILGSYGLHIEANELAVEDLKAAAGFRRERFQPCRSK